jgi:hypothetical protein
MTDTLTDAEYDEKRIEWAMDDAAASKASEPPDFDEHAPHLMPLDPSAHRASSDIEFYQRRGE